MEFIEGAFGVSPDAGSGLLEALIFVVPILILMSFDPARTFRRLGDWLRKG